MQFTDAKYRAGSFAGGASITRLGVIPWSPLEVAGLVRLEKQSQGGGGRMSMHKSGSRRFVPSLRNGKASAKKRRRSPRMWQHGVDDAQSGYYLHLIIRPRTMEQHDGFGAGAWRLSWMKRQQDAGSDFPRDEWA